MIMYKINQIKEIFIRRSDLQMYCYFKYNNNFILKIFIDIHRFVEFYNNSIPPDLTLLNIKKRHKSLRFILVITNFLKIKIKSLITYSLYPKFFN